MSKRLGYFEGLRFLSKYLKKHRRNFLLFFLDGTVEAVFFVISPIILSIMVDQIVYFRNLTVFLRIGFVFMGMTLFTSLLVFLRYTVHGYLMSMFTFDIKMDVFKKILNSKARHLAHFKSGELIHLLFYDVQECMLFMIRNVIHFTNYILRGALYLLCIYRIDYRVGLAASLFLPLSVWVTLRRQEAVRHMHEQERHNNGTYVSWLFEVIKGLVDIKLLRSQSKVRKDFASHQRGLFDIRFSVRKASWLSDAIISMTNLGLLLSVFALCAYLSYLGVISIGNVIVLVTFVTILNEDTILSCVRNRLDAQMRLTKMGRLRDFLLTEDESDWKGTAELSITQGRVEFQDVDFAYEKKSPVLAGLSFTIEPGTHFALVGKSGCGKTTIANLLIGLYEIQRGRILIDGKNIHDHSLWSVRRNIGIVQQDILLFDGTIRENILLGDPHACEEEVWQACLRAGIGDFISGLVARLDTVLGKNGLLLSGGQKQRLEIARIYLKNPAIIIFDEATSALDFETERAVHDAWKEVLSGRTAIVISHRESSVLLCDKVLMIENGQAHIAGSPEVLLRDSEAFRSLFAKEEVDV
ncbi:MAG: ABC transporter ATP-binding protein/permease [Spirochaetes bacterium]|nr:ABC transporter ATP-binding protein/permease [Spirochaetota bacterium]MBU0954558.1 ABC transporter ATP-binding protein/permease [Spirochaetota bacterium]